MKDTADASVQRRRERGRRAQAAFRKRQADQDRNLKAVISRVIAATQGDENVDLLRSIRDLAVAADLNHESTALAESKQALIPPTPSASCPSSISGLSYGQKASNWKENPDRNFRKQVKTIWLDPLALNEPSAPPQDIVPYLGQGSTRFAGVILWSCMNHGLQKCHLPHSAPLEVIERGLQHCSTSQELKALFVLDMIEARVQHIQDGALSARLTVAGEVDLGCVINGRIRREYMHRGEDVDRLWLTGVALEKCMRDMVGPKVFDVLEMGAAGKSSDFVNGLMEGFKCRLWETCVCFGDGPRWHIDVVQGLVRIVLERALEGRFA